MLSSNRSKILTDLKSEVLRLEGFNTSANQALDSRLGPIANAFPNSSFPVGAVHEFMCNGIDDTAATVGFVGGLLSVLMGEGGSTIWISSSRKLFPPALKSFGLEPDRFIFLDLREKDVLWAIDEALKCSALTAVVGEARELSFTASRRLQLAVEESKVNGFIIRQQNRQPNTTACVSRWRISSLPSEPIDELPGIGFPKWRVELSRVRNGKPATWEVQWINGAFIQAEPLLFVQQHQKIAG
jgi:protein ImuA